MTKSKILMQYYNALLKKFGKQKWWPGETPFEIMVGAVLTQNTNWKNVERAILNLKERDLLDPHKINQLDIFVLGELIKPAGYFNIKAKRLKNLVSWFVENYNGNIEALKRQDFNLLREQLLNVRGIGRETADSILLYALEYPTFVVDAYTYRVLLRHHLITEDADYEEIKEFFESNLKKDTKLYNEFHALFVAVGKNYCKSKPICEKCPLERFLP
jgi:endonuclease-3 related protein